jgi:multiple antibiotic resistance protein
MEALIVSSTALFLAIFDPLAAARDFASAVGRKGEATRRNAAFAGAGLAALLLIVFVIAGRPLVTGLRMSVAGLELIAGLVFLVLALEMLTGRHGLVRSELTDPAAIGVPRLFGPAAALAAIWLSIRAGGDALSVAIVILVGLVVIALAVVAMSFSESIEASLGARGVDLVSRLLGIFLGLYGGQVVLLALVHGLPF